jgi:holliday junction DNA helicase RuvA
MIAFLNGKLAHKDPAYVIIECAGVGYHVRISLNTYSKLGKEESVKLHTYLMIKEDAHDLYGFLDPKEKALFLQLLSIQGVGGNTALTILSSIEPKELQQVIETENLNRLKQVKGIGAKTASRIILELKGKLVIDGGASAPTGMGKLREEAIAALVSLGLPKAAMETRVDAIIKTVGLEVTIERVIKDALKQQ